MYINLIAQFKKNYYFSKLLTNKNIFHVVICSIILTLLSNCSQNNGDYVAQKDKLIEQNFQEVVSSTPDSIHNDDNTANNDENINTDDNNQLIIAAYNYIKNNFYEQAQLTLQNIHKKNLSPKMLNSYHLLISDIKLHLHQKTEAKHNLMQFNISNATNKQIIDYWQLKLQLAKYNNNISAQIIALDNLINSSKNQEIYANQLWKILENINNTKLSKIINSNLFFEDDAKSWLELANIYKNTRELIAQNILLDKLQLWLKNYPSHYENNNVKILISKIEETKFVIKKFNKIALLLPITGKYASIGKNIQKGFLQNYYNNNDDAKINIYDSNNENIISLYEKIIAEGNDVVVGPLIKEKVNKIINFRQQNKNNIAASETKLPLNLTLNYSNELETKIDGVYQFGLALSDEANNIVNMIHTTANHNLFIITQEAKWSKQISNNLVTKLNNSFDTKILEQIIVNKNNLSRKIKNSLQIAASIQRKNQLQNIIDNTVNFKMHNRQDIDAVVIIADSKYTQQIIPLLNFYYITNTPIYGISKSFANNHLFSSEATDINNLTFCALPIFANKISRNLQLNDNDKFIALGKDAYNLISNVNWLSSNKHASIEGLTGRLSFNSKQQVERQLIWFKITNDRIIKLS